MRRHNGSRQQGVSKLEFAVIVAAITVLAAVLLIHLAEVQREAERTEVELAVTSIRAGIRMAVNEHAVRGYAQNDLLGSNPVAYLRSPLRGYIGETTDVGAPGSWRFDPKARLLEYRPRRPEVFDGAEELHWRMTAEGGDGAGAGVQLKDVP